MPETVVLAVEVTVAGGPKVSLNRTVTVDAYDKINVAVPDGSSDLEVELQPGGAGQVRFLLVSSSQYGDTLTYKVNGGAVSHVLDQPHLLTGRGAVAMLAAAPTTLAFDNGLGDDAQIQVLIGRDATP